MLEGVVVLAFCLAVDVPFYVIGQILAIDRGYTAK